MKNTLRKGAIILGSAALTLLVMGVSRASAAGGSAYGPYAPHTPEETGFSGQSLLTTAGVVLYAGGVAIVSYSTLLKKKLTGISG